MRRVVLLSVKSNAGKSGTVSVILVVSGPSIQCRSCFAAALRAKPMALEASLPLSSVVTATPGHINNRLITSKLTGGKEEALPLAFHPKMANLRSRKFPLGIVKLTGRVVA